MRFNNKELAFLAKQDSSNFEREGILYMKEKSSRLLKKKDEAFVEKFFRLRGNLLFYFKGKDAKSDVQGLFVMERCSVELDLNEQQNFSFVIVFEGDEVTYTFSAKTEDDRDSWIQALHVAGYENLKMQLQSLREQVQAKTGQDPLAYIRPTDTGMDFETQAAGSSEDPAMEISMSIEGLPSDSSGLPPNPFVVIYTIVPPQQQTWMQHNHTEMVEKNNDPHFLKTVGFGDANGLEPTTRVKVTVYHVKERMTGTMTQIGQVIFTINDLLMKDDMTLHLTLIGMESRKVGSLKIVGWLNDAAGCVTDWQNNSDVFENSSKRGQSQSFKRRSKRLDTLKPLCENITTRTFRFETNDSVKLLVYEYMAESKYTFEIPIKALKVFIEEEKLRIKQLNELGKLPKFLETLVATDINIRAAVIMEYTDANNVLACYQGSSFVELNNGKRTNTVYL